MRSVMSISKSASRRRTPVARILHVLTPSGLSLLGAIGLIGCGSVGSPVENDPEVAGLPPATVSGYVYRSPAATGSPAPAKGANAGRRPAAVSAGPLGALTSLMLVDLPSSAPAGAAPSAGSEVRLVTASGRPVAVTRTAADGSYAMECAAIGFVRLEVRADPGAPAADLESGLTAYPAARLVPGRRHAVSRDSALAVALAGVPSGALVAASLQPLAAGTRVAPRDPDDGSVSSRVLGADEWLFFVDLEPFAAYAHPVEFRFVDASSARMSVVSGIRAAPVVNQGTLWGSDLDLFRYEGFDPADLDLIRPPSGASAVASPEVVQLPQVSPVRAGAPARGAPGAAGPADILDSEDLFTLNILAAHGTHFYRDYSIMSAFFARYATNPLHRGSVVFPLMTSDQALIRYRQELDRLDRLMQARLAAGGRPTLFVYLAAHSYTAPNGVPRGTIAAEFQHGKETGYGPGFLRLAAVKACKVRLILETCFSEVFARDLTASFQSIPATGRPDLVVFGSSRDVEKSYNYDDWVMLLTDGAAEPGGAFTKAFAAHAVIARDDIFGVTDPRGRYIQSMEVLTTQGYEQRPVALFAPGAPVWCGGSDFPLVEVEPASIEFTHVGSEPECAETVGWLVVRNPSQAPLDWSLTTGHLAVHADPRGGALAPGDSAVVTLTYDCGAQAAFVTEVRVHATSALGDQDASVSLRVNLDPGVVSDELLVQPAGATGVSTVSFWLWVPREMEVDSTRLVDTATMEYPAVHPWPGCDREGFFIVGESRRPGDPDRYGLTFRIVNPTLQSCDVGSLRWRYTVWYSRP